MSAISRKRGYFWQNIHENREKGGIFGALDHAIWLWGGIDTLNWVHLGSKVIKCLQEQINSNNKEIPHEKSAFSEKKG